MADGAPEAGKIVGTCPRCGESLRAIGLLGARLLAQVRRYPSEEDIAAGTADRRPPAERRTR
jgi:hypothetical protein